MPIKSPRSHSLWGSAQPDTSPSPWTKRGVGAFMISVKIHVQDVLLCYSQRFPFQDHIIHDDHHPPPSPWAKRWGECVASRALWLLLTTFCPPHFNSDICNSILSSLSPYTVLPFPLFDATISKGASLFDHFLDIRFLQVILPFFLIQNDIGEALAKM